MSHIEPLADSAPTTPAGRYVSLSGGNKVPYPTPSSEKATRFGKANPRTGTKPEVRLRSVLHRRGFRFRKDHPILAGELKVRPDIVFTAYRLAVFADGCFWHGCPMHARQPRANAGYWGPKLAANLERDSTVNAALAASGWTVVRVWEHEPVEEAADRVVRQLRAPRRN